MTFPAVPQRTEPSRLLSVATGGADPQCYVPVEDYEAVLDALYNINRVVSLAYTALVTSNPHDARDEAVGIIGRATGLTIGDARAMESILLHVRSGGLGLATTPEDAPEPAETVTS